MASATPNSELPGPTSAAPAFSPGVWGRLADVLRNDARRLVTTGVPHLLTALALTQGISIVRRILLARLLTVAELGQMTYVMQIADLVAIFADLGLCTAVLKYAAEPVGEERQRELYWAGLCWGSLSAVVVGLIYLLAVALLPIPAEQGTHLFMLLVGPYIALAAIVKTPLVFMQARKEIKRAARYTALTQTLSLVLLVGATALFQLWGFFAVVTAAPLSNLVILLVATRRDLRRFPLRGELFRKLWSLGSVSMLANAVGYANGTVAVVLLRHLTGLYDPAGYYAIALMVMTGMRLLPQALLQTAFPYLSGLLAEPARLRARMRELALKQVLVIGALALAWALVGQFVIGVIFGDRFSSAFGPSLVLLAGLLAYALAAPAAQVLIILERVQLNLAVACLQFLANASLCLALIPRHEVLGATIAVSVAEGLACMATLVCVRRALRGRVGSVSTAKRGELHDR